MNCKTILLTGVFGLALSVLPALGDAPEGRQILAADRGHIALMDVAGKVLWKHDIGGTHDLGLLANGNILVGDGATRVLEIERGTEGKPDKIVWEYDAAKQNRTDGKRVEVHGFQRLADGNTLIAESGPARLIEVDKDGKLVKEIKLTVKHPSTHSDTRTVRKLETGHYLVCHENDGTLREYDGDGKVVWDYEVPLFGKKEAGGHNQTAFGNHLFSALRLASGNTLIATGNGHSIIEVTPDKQIVWQITQDELPGISLAWVTTLQLQPNGDIIFGNCHAGEKYPQIVEVNRDKKVVWQFRDWKTLGDATSNSMVLDPK